MPKCQVEWGMQGPKMIIVRSEGSRLWQVNKLTDFGTKGADLDNIYYLRDTRDGDAIVAGIAEAKKAGNKVHLPLPLPNSPAVLLYLGP